MPDEVTGLRERIAALDQSILRAAAERLDLAAQVGIAKHESGLPIRSYQTETAVLARYRAGADQLGVDRQFAESLGMVLISEAVRRQERGRLETEAADAATPVGRQILIVGGAGKMGRWLVRFFIEQGHDVAVLDPGGSVKGARSIERLEDGMAFDVILLAMPLSKGPEVLRAVLSCEPSGLIVDISSLKSHLLNDLRAGVARGLRLASLHPLFGPGVQTLAGRVMAVCDCGHSEAADEAASLFESTSLTISRMSVERHDEYMQYVLGLSHLTSILFATTLARSGYAFGELSAVASTTFIKQARTASEVVCENAEMYGEIQRLNRHSKELYQLVRESLAALESGTLGDDAAALSRIIIGARDYFPAEVPRDLA